MPIVDRTRENIERQAKNLLQISNEYQEGKIGIEYLLKASEVFVETIRQNPIQVAVWIMKGVRRSEEIEKTNRERNSREIPSKNGSFKFKEKVKKIRKFFSKSKN